MSAWLLLRNTKKSWGLPNIETLNIPEIVSYPWIKGKQSSLQRDCLRWMKIWNYRALSEVARLRSLLISFCNCLINASIALPADDCLPTFSLLRMRSRISSSLSRLSISLSICFLSCPVASGSVCATGLSIFPAVPPVAYAIRSGWRCVLPVAMQ